MEVLNLSGYTTDDKEKISKKFLLPRQIEENGLKSDSISIKSDALRQIIEDYTSEAGLRNLERELGAICRKIARQIAEGKKGPFHITKGSLHKYLGIPKYLPEMDQEESQIGLATGLAWTNVGGEVLYVEASLMEGKGELIITGQLGEVMQESARAAVSYARLHCQSFGLKKKFFESIDIHIHVPAGAIPKDGPSAGIAMTIALISAIIEKPVNTEVAMTGEITLRGRVLPIGGLREKSLGALRAGIKTIIHPEKNNKDMDEIPKIVKRKIKFLPVSSVNEALEIAIGREALPQTDAKKTKRKKH
jgi:ATP-dependent Lon protease